MTALFARTLSGTIEAVVRVVVLPIANLVPFLVRTRILFGVFAALWVAFGAAFVLDRGMLDAVWARLVETPLLVQGVAWLLFLPVTAALWVWSTDWPELLRTLVVVALGAWNLLVLLPSAGVSSNAEGDASPTVTA